MLPVRRPSSMADDVDGLGVFVPGLMGAGLLVSMAMLLADGFRRLVPSRGRRAWAAALVRRARGRVEDLRSVSTGAVAVPWRPRRVPRGRLSSLAWGVALAGLAVAAVAGSVAIYHGKEGVLSDRGWTLAGGFLLGAPLGLLALVAIVSAALGRARPGWLARLSAAGPLGRLPDPDEVLGSTDLSG